MLSYYRCEFLRKPCRKCSSETANWHLSSFKEQLKLVLINVGLFLPSEKFYSILSIDMHEDCYISGFSRFVIPLREELCSASCLSIMTSRNLWFTSTTSGEHSTRQNQLAKCKTNKAQSQYPTCSRS